MKLMKFLRGAASHIMLAVAGLGLGFALGSYLGVDTPNGPEITPPPAETADPVGQMGVVSVLPTTQVIWRYRFMSCGHTLEAPAQDITGYTLEDITKAYPNAQVLRMDKDLVEIELRVEEYCPDHYLLITTEEDVLGVFRTNLVTLASEQVMQLPISPLELPESVRYQLLDGLSFTSLEEINAYLEDVES